MTIREWALIIFTLLTQMSVGAFLVLGAIRIFVLRKAGEDDANQISDRVLLVVIASLGLGMLASVFHLGNPINAPRAVTNLASSWLSREILFGVTFAVLVLIFVGLQWFKFGSIGLRNAIALLAALMGVALVYSQAQVYMLPAQPSWNTLATPINFFTTTLLLGLLAIGVALGVNHAYLRRKSPDRADTHYELIRSIVRWIAIASIFLVGVELFVFPIYLADLGTGSSAGLQSLSLIAGRYSSTLVLRLVLEFIAVGVLAIFLYQGASGSGKERVSRYLASGAFALVLATEVFGRFMFYSTHFRIGV